MSETSTRRRGRPRSERARRAVLDAVLALAAERDANTITMDAIARRAGVSKDTLYRWWRSRTEVVLEALAERGEETIAVPDLGSLEADLTAFLRATVASATPTTQRLLRSIASEAARDGDAATVVRERFVESRRRALRAVLARAAERGELDGARIELLIDLVYGSLWYRVVFAVAPLDDAWADGIVRLLASARAPAEIGGTGA
ncbi:MAG TPA: TetR/AcrR family transcriptional regulator [Solirubrobacteraceae bacterium]|nr:TetR/AcrR family transcriptional regulator [Solirubrobacteraceae bacterium]